MDNALTRMKNILGIQSDNQDINHIEEALKESYRLQKEALLAYLGTEEVPVEVEYVVIETALARYNQRGSEGLESEDVESVSKSYTQDILEPYYSVLDKYSTKSKLRMI